LTGNKTQVEIYNMSETLIEKITSEVSSYYTTVNQYRPDNDLALRTKLRKTLQAKLQPYVDGKLIDSFTVICDESNNDTRDVKQPVKLEVIVRVSKSSPQHTISFPSKTNQQDQKTANRHNSLWDKSKGGAESLWDKLFGKRSG
jgi:phage tail sheath protein FI